MFQKARSWSALVKRQRRLACKAWCWMAAVRLLLWLLPFRTVRRVCEWAGCGTDRGGFTRDEIGWGIHAVARCVPRATCLTRALAAQILLRRNGHDARVHIGVMLDDRSGFHAHAWVDGSGRDKAAGNEGEDYGLLLVL